MQSSTNEYSKDIQHGLISEDGRYKYFLRDEISFLGRGESCNFQVRDSFLSSRHAKVIYKNNEITIEDLGSTNGIYLNGEKISSSVIKPGDIVQIGKTRFQLKTQKIDSKNNKRTEGTSFFKIPGSDKETAKASDLVKVKLDKESILSDQTAFLQLDKIKFEEDMDEDFYIFEDDEEIFPVLESSDTDCLEFIKMYKDTIISIDYIPIKDDSIIASGKVRGNYELHFDSLSKNQRKELISYRANNKATFSPVENHENFVIRSGKAHEVEKKIVLKDDDLIKIKKDDYSINIKRTVRDYRLLNEPFGGRDRTFKICIVLGLVIGLFLFSLSLLYTPEKKVVKQVKKKKVTKVIYKKPKPKPKPKIVKPKPVEKIEPIKVKEKVEQSAKSVNVEEKVRKKVEKVTVKKQVTKKKPQRVKSKRKVRKASKKVVKSRQENIKKVDAFSDFSFSKDLKALKTNKRRSKNFGMKSAESVGARQRAQGLEGGDVSAAKSGSEVSKIDIGSIGEISNSKGVGSFGINKNTKFSKTYGKTVLLGSIDPEIIRELLRRNLPQFRYCYDDELRRQRKKVKGKMELDFVISPNGRVGRSDIGLQAFKMTATGVRCMRTVLHAIRFPKPKGGGIVEVKQPIFLEPEY